MCQHTYSTRRCCLYPKICGWHVFMYQPQIGPCHMCMYVHIYIHIYIYISIYIYICMMCTYIHILTSSRNSKLLNLHFCNIFPHFMDFDCPATARSWNHLALAVTHVVIDSHWNCRVTWQSWRSLNESWMGNSSCLLWGHVGFPQSWSKSMGGKSSSQWQRD